MTTETKQLTKLDSVAKAKWLEALRSGAYSQARKELAHNGSLCCIGVGYCVITGNPIQRAYSIAEDAVDNDEISDETNVASEAIGLNKVTQDKLVDLNDLYRCNFNEIADWIENNL